MWKALLLTFWEFSGFYSSCVEFGQLKMIQGKLPYVSGNGNKIIYLNMFFPSLLFLEKICKGCNVSVGCVHNSSNGLHE